MEYEYPLDQERLERDVDALFERSDKRIHAILNLILKEVRNGTPTGNGTNTRGQNEGIRYTSRGIGYAISPDTLRDE